MLKIVARFIIKEDRIEEFIKYATELVTESRKEEGCVSYELLQDVNNCTVLTFIEEWKDKEAHMIHEKTNHFQGISSKFGELQQKKVDVNFYNKLK
ncbi:MAG TPA: putative quinol monooxygenase [Ruminiclostridium sp.]